MKRRTFLEICSIFPISIYANDIYSVETIEQLLKCSKNIKQVIVKDSIRGGLFKYDANKSYINNEGTIFYGWIRQFDGNVQLKWFGTNSKAIQKANDFASLLKVSLEFEPIEYILDEQLTISTIWNGIVNKTKLIISEHFSIQSTIDPISYSAITNSNLAKRYIAKIADYIEINNIIFIHRSNSTYVKETIALANVKGGKIENCNFYTETESIVTPIDLFSCVKNFTLKNVKVSNRTGAQAGGSMWIRNITLDGFEIGNVTENITIDSCSFSTSTTDEALAIYGVYGLVKNVKIFNSTCESSPSKRKHGTLASTFPLGKSLAAGVENIHWDSCTFITNNFRYHVLRIGSSEDQGYICNNISVTNCKFIVNLTKNEGPSHIARNIPCQGSNIIFNDNIIDATKSSSSIDYGVIGFDTVRRNKIFGKIDQGLVNCKEVSTNEIKGVKKPFVNCQVIRH